jgi:hypothetical protein
MFNGIATHLYHYAFGCDGAMDFRNGYSGFFLFFDLENMNDVIDVNSIIFETHILDPFNYFSSI